STTYHAIELDRLIARGMQKKGFSVIEVLTQCPVSYGELNQKGDAVEMLKWFRDNTTTARGKAPPGKIARGVLVDRDAPGYVESYLKVITASKRGSRT
ncbi:MAG: 2-oxoacid:ferredoxin oxidoreductase subunit beta, partial [Dehalococcoidia bacterium]